MTTKRLRASVLSTELDHLAKQPLDQADDAVLVRAAQAVWYSNTSLDSALDSFMLKKRSQIELRRAGYLLERLTQFNCLTIERATEAFRVLHRVLPHKTGKAVATGRVDRLALSWGLDTGLGLKAQVLMPYQTRHYEATQRQSVAS